MSEFVHFRKAGSDFMSLARSVWNVAHTTPEEKGKKRFLWQPCHYHRLPMHGRMRKNGKRKMKKKHEEAEPEEQDARNDFVNLP